MKRKNERVIEHGYYDIILKVKSDLDVKDSSMLLVI